jgi:hypothetical protein
MKLRSLHFCKKKNKKVSQIFFLFGTMPRSPARWDWLTRSLSAPNRTALRPAVFEQASGPTRNATASFELEGKGSESDDHWSGGGRR